jgi:hypothetical protein
MIVRKWRKNDETALSPSRERRNPSSLAAPKATVVGIKRHLGFSLKWNCQIDGPKRRPPIFATRARAVPMAARCMYFCVASRRSLTWRRVTSVLISRHLPQRTDRQADRRCPHTVRLAGDRSDLADQRGPGERSQPEQHRLCQVSAKALSSARLTAAGSISRPDSKCLSNWGADNKIWL